MGCYCFFVKQVTNRFKGEFAIEKIKNYTMDKHTKKEGGAIAHPLEEMTLTRKFHKPRRRIDKV